MKRIDVTLAEDHGQVRSLPDYIVSLINTDGTMKCSDCGKHLPPTTSPRDRNVGILWSHRAAGSCVMTEADFR